MSAMTPPEAAPMRENVIDAIVRELHVREMLSASPAVLDRLQAERIYRAVLAHTARPNPIRTGADRSIVERAEHARKTLTLCSASRVGAMLQFSREEREMERAARPDAGDSNRKALIEIANMIPGCFAKDGVTDELLALIPAEVRAWTEKLTARPDAGDEVERVAFTGHDRMDRPTMDDVWRKSGWGHDVVANRTTVMRFIGTIDALEAELAAMREGVDRGMVEPVAWRWEGRNGSGHWVRQITGYCPDQNDPDYCRKVEPLYLSAALSRKGG